MRHAQRSKNLFANRAFPTETGELSFEVAHGHDGEIVVLIGAAKTFVRLEIAQAVDQVFAAEVGGIQNEVVARKTRAMRENRRGWPARSRPDRTSEIPGGRCAPACPNRRYPRF